LAINSVGNSGNDSGDLFSRKRDDIWMDFGINRSYGLDYKLALQIFWI